MPLKLSGGEKQRLCVARAIVNNPGVIVADEPTGNLDTALAKDIMDLLVKISRFGKTVIVVTHASDLVKLYNERIILIKDGKLVSDTKYPKLKTNAVPGDAEHDIDEHIENSEFTRRDNTGSETPHMTYTDFGATMQDNNDNIEEDNR